MLEDVEAELVDHDLYVKDRTDSGGINYVPGSKAGTHVADMQRAIPGKVDDLRALIDLVRDLDTSATEMVTTLYAVWNDDLIDGRQTSDDAVVAGVLDEWHPEKRIKFTADDLHHWLAWMKRNGLTPRGNGPRTIETMPKDLFAGSGNQDQKGERR
jgi:type I restriction enzyme S subunit